MMNSYYHMSFLLILWSMVLTDKGLISGHGLIGDGNSNGTVSFENWDYPGCGFEEPSTERILAMRREERRYTSKSRPLYVYSLFCRYFPDSRFCLPSVEIDVYIHSVQTISGTGRLSTSAIRAMVRQASSSFRLSGFRFRVRGIRSIVNSNYYNSATRSDEEIALMTKHKRGGAETLNVYLKRVHNDRGGFCGYANLAQQAANAGVRDSVVINPACAGDEKTMAHEIGHWLNLLHTFSGGCSPGDLVDDTSAQSEYLGRVGGNCPAPYPDSCPGHRGRDPLDNMMDYSPVNCPDRFTRGQIERMHQAWNQYRAIGLEE